MLALTLGCSDAQVNALLGDKGGARTASAAAPTITEFTSALAEVEDGTSTTLRWKTSDAKEVTLNTNPVALNESAQSVTPTTKPETTYTLLAKSADGEVSKSVVIKVKAKAAAPAPSATPGAPAPGAPAPAAPSCDPPKHFDAVVDPTTGKVDPTKGHVVLIKNGCVAIGDISVGDSDKGPWYQAYDSNPKTGLVITCDDDAKKDCFLRMDYGGDVNSTQTADELVNGALASGCGSKCDSAKSVSWTRERCSMNAKGITGPFFKDACIPAPAPSPTPSPVPSPSPSPTASPTPAPIKTQALAPADDCTGEFQAMVIRLAKAGCIITGDVEAYVGPTTTSAPTLPTTLTAANVGEIKKMLQQQWKPLHDNLQYTGAVVVITQDTWILPLYRGAGLHGPPATVLSLQLGELATGCDIAGGCTKIDATFASWP